MKKIEQALALLKTALMRNSQLQDEVEILVDAEKQLAELKEQIKQYRDESTNAIISEQKVWQKMTEYKRQLAELKQRLKEIEWSASEEDFDYNSYDELEYSGLTPVCPACRHGGEHSESCWLKRASESEEG